MIKELIVIVGNVMWYSFVLCLIAAFILFISTDDKDHHM
jgi:hypothetical protein